MTILYALVSRGKTVLSEYSAPTSTGNFPLVTRVVLSKVPPVDGKMTYVYDNYVFHYIVENGICYLCMSDELTKHRLPYAFLNDIKERFIALYGLESPQTAIAFSFNERFSVVISERMEYFNSDNPDIDNISAVRGQIDEVKDVMVQNIEKVLERGEKIDLLVDKTDRLNGSAFRFERSSRNLERSMYWKRFRIIAGITLLVALVIFIAIASACGGLSFHNCKK
mmetsp:Transcript_40318/g.59255  ORF Transcript_40318/g.59255 Transcript_40318/m.59255 type:complete len:224 (-) Transcript_40318:339-1010(-)|eukprot:CAMPEP_0195519764 /NCGR_PEP_ID=MMETSP0794_2-20130614/15429_1 /TAXON_ID=515487 /ORGANISM="Stephanopyxis turris, Strain CCMP 815" /LENGTH=223 /DNA_ID=CAMNT_0040648971 /DNA_START=167 /DNA_END=838 /DNA_ORIENTATION=+